MPKRSWESVQSRCLHPTKRFGPSNPACNLDAWKLQCVSKVPIKRYRDEEDVLENCPKGEGERAVIEQKCRRLCVGNEGTPGLVQEPGTAALSGLWARVMEGENQPHFAAANQPSARNSSLCCSSLSTLPVSCIDQFDFRDGMSHVWQIGLQDGPAEFSSFLYWQPPVADMDFSHLLKSDMEIQSSWEAAEP